MSLLKVLRLLRRNINKHNLKFIVVLVRDDEEGYNIEMVDQDPKPVSSYHSADWYDQEEPITLHRKLSKAASLTKAVISGKNEPHRQASGLSLCEKSNFNEAEQLEDMYLEDILAASKQKKQSAPEQQNIRRAMGFWKLMCHDLKVWYRRWRVKEKESLIFKSYIKKMESNFGSAIGSLFVFMRWVIVLDFWMAGMWLGFVVFPTAVFFNYDAIEGSFAFKNLLDGKGVLAQMWFFYGSYDLDIPGYNVSLVYLFMCLLTYFGSFFVILSSLRQGSGSRRREQDKRFKFNLLLWTSWDHSITSEEASINLSKGITSVLKDNLYEVKATQDVKQWSRKEKCKIYCLRILAWLITIILIGGGCALIVFLVVFMTFDEMVSNTGGKNESNFLSIYGTTIVFSLINIIVPVCIRQLPKMEHYLHGKVELNITLTRIFFLRTANLFALITSLYETITLTVKGCAGTILGQEMYKVVIMDTILHTVTQLSVTFGKYLWTKQKTEFDISSAVLVLVYRQALVWVGTVACPVMPLVGLLSNLIFMAVNYTVVSYTCKPPIKRWNQSRNTAFFSYFLLASVVLLILPFSVIIGSSEVVNLGHTELPDSFCGPWGADKPTRSYTNFWEQQVPWLQATLKYLVSEIVLIPAFFVLLSILFHLNQRIGLEKQQNVIIHTELQQEREENEKLLKKLQSMGVAVERL
ncbi:transmembrane channel-like protein 1 [Mya arenaria]|uniref:transmembrane channel-like protein 1 n=1 Tax=Mya arenaria TaxID=6604 RepID=UPI0022E59CB6|nr:transmembrane channel-like protein 1 [Mya arenaria]